MCLCITKGYHGNQLLVKKDFKVIDVDDFAELGGRGDTVFVKKSLGRNTLLAQGLAVYPSQENKDMFTEERRVSYLFSSHLLVRLLTRSNVKLFFSVATERRTARRQSPDTHRTASELSCLFQMIKTT